jgi:hypothetical protein
LTTKAPRHQGQSRARGARAFRPHLGGSAVCRRSFDTARRGGSLCPPRTGCTSGGRAGTPPFYVLFRARCATLGLSQFGLPPSRSRRTRSGPRLRSAPTADFAHAPPQKSRRSRAGRPDRSMLRCCSHQPGAGATTLNSCSKLWAAYGSRRLACRSSGLSAFAIATRVQLDVSRGEVAMETYSAAILVSSYRVLSGCTLPPGPSPCLRAGAGDTSFRVGADAERRGWKLELLPPVRSTGRSCALRCAPCATVPVGLSCHARIPGRGPDGRGRIFPRGR